MVALQHPKNQNKRQDIATKILAYIDEKKICYGCKNAKTALQIE